MSKKVEERSFRMGPIGPYIDPDQGDFGAEAEDMVPYVIDLGASRRGNLDESFLTMFGGAVEMMLKRMFGGSSVPVMIKGTKNQVDSFGRALSGEKKYLEAAKKYGLDDPRTFKNKGKLDKSIAEFERETGLKWPFK